MKSDPNLRTRTNFLSVIGILCEEIDERFIDNATVTTVLDGIFSNISGELPIELTRIEIKTLSNLLFYCQDVFQNVKQRDLIIQFILRNTQHSDEEVRKASFDGLINLTTEHYSHLKDYIDIIEDFTIKEISNTDQDPDIRLLAIEFWCSLAEVEDDYIEQADVSEEFKIELKTRRKSNKFKENIEYII